MDKWENKRFFARINGRWDLGKAVGRIRLGEEGLREALCRIWGAATATREMGARCSAIARPRRRDLAVTHASWVHARELRRAHTGKCAHCPARLSPDVCCCPLPKGFLLSLITHCHGLYMSLMTRGSCATRMAFVPLSFSSALRIIAHETRWPASRRGQGRVGRSRMQVIEGQSNGYRLGATKALAAIVTRGVRPRTYAGHTGSRAGGGEWRWRTELAGDCRCGRW